MYTSNYSLRSRIADWFYDNSHNILLAVVFLIVTGIVATTIILSNGAHQNGTHEGTVTDKSYHHSTSQTVCTGKPLICRTNRTSEHWDVEITNNGESNTFEVEETQYNTINLGDYLTFDGDTLAAAR